MTDDGSHNSDGKEEEEEGANGVPKTSYLAGGALGANGALAGVAAVSMNPLPLIAGIAGTPSATYVIYQNKKLQDLGSVREANNKIREETNRLAVENAKLKESIGMLEGNVNRLKAVEESLGTMAEQQGSDVNKLTELVKENQKTIDEMKRLMKGKISQNIISTVLKCDDGDFKLDDREVDILCLRLNNIEGVTFHENTMRDIIKKKDGDVLAVMTVIRDLLSDEPTGPTVFDFDFEDDED